MCRVYQEYGLATRTHVKKRKSQRGGVDMNKCSSISILTFQHNIALRHIPSVITLGIFSLTLYLSILIFVLLDTNRRRSTTAILSFELKYRGWKLNAKRGIGVLRQRLFDGNHLLEGTDGLEVLK